MGLRGRRYLILCWLVVCLMALLSGSVVSASAHAQHHRRHHHHKRHHRRHHKKKKKKVVATLSVLPYMGAAPSPTVFGVNTLGYVTSSSNFLSEMPTAQRMGARWVHFTNDSIKFTNGQPKWSTLDYQITKARQLGMGVLISLGGTPKACSVSPRPSDFTGCPPTTAGDLSAYASYLQQELVRYRNVVQYYESWLEPNGHSYWLGGANPRQYANLLKTQYQVFQQVNSTYHTNLKLLFGGPLSFGTAPGSPGSMAVLPFVNQVLNDLHGARAFDGIGLHAYRFPAATQGPADWGPTALEWDYVGGLSFPEGLGCTGGAAWCQMTWSDELQSYEQEFANHGYGQMPLWLTEFGWPGTATPSGANFPSFDIQSRYVSQAYTDILKLPFIQAAFYFNLEDYTPGASSGDPQAFYHYGLLQYGFAQKPAAAVYEQFLKANPGR